MKNILRKYYFKLISKKFEVTPHQTGEVNALNLFYILFFSFISLFIFILQIYSYSSSYYQQFHTWWHHILFSLFIFIQITVHVFVFSISHELTWTIVGRTGMREQGGRGEAMGLGLGYLTRLIIVFFLLLFLPSNFYKYLILQILLSFYCFFHPILYSMYIYKTKNGWINNY